MKKSYIILAFLIALFSNKSASGNIVVTPGAGGTNICANLAVGGIAPAYTTLGVITMTESLNGDMTNGFHLVTLNAPAGWQFNTLAAPVLGFTPGRNITAVTFISLTAGTLTFFINVGGVTLIDAVTITGLQVQATGAGSAAGNITAGVAAGLTGVATGVTNFGSLSLTPSLVPSVSIAGAPGGAICPGTNVTFTATPVNGGVPTYQWFLNGVLVVGVVGNTYSNNTLANGNTIRVTMTPTGCRTLASVNSNIITEVVNPAPNAVTVAGGGAFCDNTTITASLVGAGTIYYEGVTSGGVSVATPSVSQVIATQGTHTYFFRARSAGGCWGVEGSAVVTITNTPGAVTVTPVTTSNLCLGGSAQFAASGASAPTVEILQQDFNSGLGGWTITNIAGIANSYFQIRNSPGYNALIVGDGTPYMEAAPDATGSPATPTNTLFTSPSFSLANYTSATLTFNQRYLNWPTGDTTVDVEYSIDGGATWTSFFSDLGAAVGAGNWVSTTPTTTVAFPPAAIGQPNVMIRWNYNSDWGWYWAVDNIAVTGTPVLTYDWAGVAGATGLSCATCDTTTITPAALGGNDYVATTTVAGCTSLPGGVTITVTPPPAGSVIPASTTLCHGLPVHLIGTAAGCTFQWEKNGVVIAGATDASYTATTSGNYTLFIDNGICTVPLPVINVLPDPVAVVSYNVSGNSLYTGSYSSYQWLLNGTAIAGATSSIYPPTVTGVYQVAIKDVHGCTDTSVGYAYSGGGGGGTGVSNTSVTGGISVYPNPANSVLNIDAPCSVNIIMLSPDGKTVLSQQNAHNVNIGGLANGVYFMSVYSEDGLLLKTVKCAKVE